ncbi:MAG: arginase family protein [Bacteroidota bacterium]
MEKAFNENAATAKNGNFMGLPFTYQEADLILYPVPWDVTTSYKDGTHSAWENILEASYQLDLKDPYGNDEWKRGFFLTNPNAFALQHNKPLRQLAIQHIDRLENQEEEWDAQEEEYLAELNLINEGSTRLVEEIEKELESFLDAGKLVGLIGGEHSVPLGMLKALAKVHDSFGVLTIDAHMDLREEYEGFVHSHASIFYHVSSMEAVSQLVQVGIRDWCQEEEEYVEASEGKIKVFFDHQLKEGLFKGKTWHEWTVEIIETLPQKVYISFDIDGLDPSLCPHTGTAVPGGLSFEQAMYLIHQIVESGRQMIGFDLSEVAGIGHEWDGNVGARVLYRLSNQLLKSNPT